MPFAQVKEDKNGQKVLVPITESTSTTAADALALAENALPKTGGEITGSFSLKSNTLDQSDLPSATKFNRILFKDVNGNIIANTGVLQGTSGNLDALLQANNRKEDGSEIQSTLRAIAGADGTTYATAPNPDLATAPDNAIMTKKAVADNYLAKTGGEITGNLTRTITLADLTEKPASVKSGVFGVAAQDGDILGSLNIARRVNGDTDSGIWARNKTASGELVEGVVRVYALQDGTAYATATNPRSDNYGTDIVNMKAMKDYAPMKVADTVNIHVNAETGSDTADLFAGRGFSEEKPFKSLPAALNWIAHNLVNDTRIHVILHSDITFSKSYTAQFPNVSSIGIQSDNTRRTITCMTGFTLSGAVVKFENLNFAINMNGEGNMFYLTGFEAGIPKLVLKDCNFTGSCGTLIAAFDGSIAVIQNALTGNVDAKKYNCLTGSTIIGASRIPGTIDGTHDASSIIAD